MSLKAGTSTPQTFKDKVEGQLCGGGSTVLGMRAELGTWSLSGSGTGGACWMLQPRMTTDFLLLNKRWIFCTHPQPGGGQMKATMESQPTLGSLWTTLHQAAQTKTNSLNHQKLLAISTDIYSSLCSQPFGMKGLTNGLKWDFMFGAGSAVLSQPMELEAVAVQPSQWAQTWGSIEKQALKQFPSFKMAVICQWWILWVTGLSFNKIITMQFNFSAETHPEWAGN